MNILWRLKICLKKKGWNDRLSNAQKLQTDNSATACAITDNQSRYSGIVARLVRRRRTPPPPGDFATPNAADTPRRTSAYGVHFLTSK